MQKLTIKDLIANKEKYMKKEKRTLELYIESIDAKVTIQEPSKELAIEALDLAQDVMKSEKADPHVIYHTMIEPNLKDAELQKAFGCVEPTDIVNKIFRAGEISQMSGHALSLAGYGQSVTKLDKELKN